MANNNFPVELTAIRAKLNQENYIDERYRYRWASTKILKYLNAMFDKALREIEIKNGVERRSEERRTIRKKIIGFIIQNEDLSTSMELTQWQASTLVEYGQSEQSWKPNDKFTALVENCEKAVREIGGQSLPQGIIYDEKILENDPIPF